MNQQTINFLIWFSPLLVGGVIAAVNSNEVNNATEKAEAWSRITQSNASKKKSSIYRYLINPIFYTLVVFSDWTDSFVHRGLKNGIRVAIALYLIAAWCFFIYAAFMIAFFIVLTAIVLYVAFKIMGIFLDGAANSDDNIGRSFHKENRIIGSVGPGKRINQETGRIEKDGLLGWSDTNERIDPETGKVQTEGWFGWTDSKTRIDQENGNVQKEWFWGYSDTNTRINVKTGVIQKNGFLGWEDTDERINPETGKRQKNGMFGWRDE